MTNTTPYQEDRAAGLVSAPIAVRVIDGVPGWTTCVMLADGTIWAYAPTHYALETGIIAQQVA